MPQLSSDAAKMVDEAEGGSFDPVPEGVYLAALESDPEVKEGPKGPYWVWVFKIADGEEYAGRKFWVNTSLAPDAAWKLKEVFSAFGVPTSTATEDLIGQTVKLLVTQKIQEKGVNAGNMQNEVKQCLPASEGAAARPTGAASSAAKKDEPPLY